jgi:predicted AAA+ superfamily ATPase
MDKLRPFMGSHIIKVLSGQRRAGKSYLLYQLMDELQGREKTANIVYINTEFSEFQHLRGSGELYEYIKSRQKKRRKNYAFIDEIQEISRFEEALKSLYAEGDWDLYITGSNAHLLSGDLATYLAGRYIQFQVHPLSYLEFLKFFHLPSSTETVLKYLRIGGMPYLSSLPDVLEKERLASEYLRNVYESILLRDVVVRENIRNIRFLENLVSYLADNVGNIFSANNISKYLKSQRVNMPVQSVINYLGALEKSLFVHRTERLDLRGLKIFEIGEKYYFEDTGLRNVLVKGAGADDTAKLIENAVYLFLVQQGYTVYCGKDADAEIDFAAEKQGQRVYVQAAYRVSGPKTEEREFGNLERLEDHFPKYVVTLDDEIPKTNKRGIKHRKLKDFLLEDI